MKSTIKAFIFIFATVFSFGLFAQSRLPADPENWLAGSIPNTTGDKDGINVIFFEIPDSVNSTLYFAVKDPGTFTPESPNTTRRVDWIRNNQADDPEDVETRYSLLGGSGVISDPRARENNYSGDESRAFTGIILSEFTYKNEEVTSNGGWVYFEGVSPRQGEKIGSKYYFKIVVHSYNTSGGSTPFKNGYQLNISYSNRGEPTSIPGVRSFAYSWCLMFTDRDRNWELYPFIPRGESGNIVVFNYDFDFPEPPDIRNAPFSGRIYKTENPTPVTYITLSNDQTTIQSSIAIKDDPPDDNIDYTNRTWRLLLNEPENNTDPLNPNPAEVYFANESSPGNLYRTYAAPYSPLPPDHVALTPSDGKGAAGTKERVLVQIVDAVGGENLPYAIDLTVSVDYGSIAATDSMPGLPEGTTSVNLTTNNEGWSYIDVTSSQPGEVRISVEANLPESLENPDNNQEAVVIFYDKLPPEIKSASNITFDRNDPPSPGPDITITNPESWFPEDESFSLSIPGNLDISFDPTVTPEVTFSGAGEVNLSAITSKKITYTLRAAVPRDESITIRGVVYRDFNTESAGSLELEYGSGQVSRDLMVYSVIDTSPPEILRVETGDLNHNGYLDSLKVIFTKTIKDITVNSDNFTFPQEDFSGTDLIFTPGQEGDLSNDNVIYLSIAGDNTFTTDALPQFIYNHTTAPFITDQLGNEMEEFSLLGWENLTYLDRAPPGLLSAIASDGSGVGDGIDSDDQVILTFSEPVIPPEPPITSNNINTLLSLNNSHSWLDFSGRLTSLTWPDSQTLEIVLSGENGLPSIAPGDIITLRDDTFLDEEGNPASGESPRSIQGTFNPTDYEFISRRTRDLNGNGLIDTITFTASRPLNDDFRGLKIEVSGFGEYSGETNIENLIPGDNSFDLRISEGLIYNTAITPEIRIIENWTLMAGQNPSLYQLLKPDSTPVTASDGAGPVLVNTLARHGKAQIYLYFSEPVASALNTANIQYNGPQAIKGVAPLLVNTDATREFIVFLQEDLTPRDIMNLETTITCLGEIQDRNRNSTDASQHLPHRISDVIIDILSPTFAYNKAHSNYPITDFTHTQGLIPGNLYIQASSGQFEDLPLQSPKLIYRVISGDNWKHTEFWLPEPLFNLVTHGTGESTEISIKNENQIIDFTISNPQEIKSGKILEFIFKTDESNGLFHCTLANPNDLTTLRPWRIFLQEEEQTSGEVTVYNNVITPHLNEEVTIRYKLAREGQVTITIFDLKGDIVQLQRKHQSNGTHYFSWDGKNRSGSIVARGLYFIKITSPEHNALEKVMIVK